MKRKKARAIVAVLWLIFAGILCWLRFGFRQEERVQVPVKKEIEQAIQVKDLENKFVFVQRVSLGGAGGGGLGVPMVICSSAQQFVDLVPEKEPVFTAFEYPVLNEREPLTLKRRCGCRSQNELQNDNCIKKVYWAFIESRAGLMVYEDKYCREGFEVEKYTPEMIYFYHNNLEERFGIFLSVLVFGGILMVFVSVFGLE